jgi:hypothetical protein
VTIRAFRYCPACGSTPLQESADKFCFRDGTKLVAKAAHCPCGSWLHPWRDRFCANCGLHLSKAVVSEVEV